MPWAAPVTTATGVSGVDILAPVLRQADSGPAMAGRVSPGAGSKIVADAEQVWVPRWLIPSISTSTLRRSVSTAVIVPLIQVVSPRWLNLRILDSNCHNQPLSPIQFRIRPVVQLLR